MHLHHVLSLWVGVQVELDLPFVFIGEIPVYRAALQLLRLFISQVFQLILSPAVFVGIIGLIFCFLGRLVFCLNELGEVGCCLTA